MIDPVPLPLPIFPVALVLTAIIADKSAEAVDYTMDKLPLIFRVIRPQKHTFTVMFSSVKLTVILATVFKLIAPLALEYSIVEVASITVAIGLQEGSIAGQLV